MNAIDAPFRFGLEQYVKIIFRIKYRWTQIPMSHRTIQVVSTKVARKQVTEGMIAEVDASGSTKDISGRAVTQSLGHFASRIQKLGTQKPITGG